MTTKRQAAPVKYLRLQGHLYVAAASTKIQIVYKSNPKRVEVTLPSRLAKHLVGEDMAGSAGVAGPLTGFLDDLHDTIRVHETHKTIPDAELREIRQVFELLQKAEAKKFKTVNFIFPDHISTEDTFEHEFTKTHEAEHSNFFKWVKLFDVEARPNWHPSNQIVRTIVKACLELAPLKENNITELEFYERIADSTHGQNDGVHGNILLCEMAPGKLIIGHVTFRLFGHDIYRLYRILFDNDMVATTELLSDLAGVERLMKLGQSLDDAIMPCYSPPAISAAVKRGMTLNKALAGFNASAIIHSIANLADWSDPEKGKVVLEKDYKEIMERRQKWVDSRKTRAKDDEPT